jgi:hypothetical protein
MTFAQAHSGTAPILVDEFHTGSFQGAADCEVVRCSHRSLVVGQFGAADRGNHDSYFRGFSLVTRLVDRACNAVPIGKNSDAGLLAKRRNSWR